MLKKLVVLAFVLISCFSCQENKQKERFSVNGVWESVGSGWVLHINDSTDYNFYDVTNISCLPNRKGKFKELGKSLYLKNDTLNLIKGVIKYQFVRKNKLPELCVNAFNDVKNEDQLYNFEVFAETVKEHYAFFELNDLNWNEIYTKQKAKIKNNVNDVELYNVIEETLEMLKDNHAFLEATDEVYNEIDELTNESENLINADELPEYGDFQVANKVAKHHMQEKLTKDSKLIKWGKLNDDTGYIQIKAMWLFGDLNIPQKLKKDIGFVDAYIETFHKMYEGDYIEKEVNGVSVIMDRVMRDLSEMKSIVIDVRFNGGGQDAVSFEILSRFIKEKELQVATQKLRVGKGHSPIFSLKIKGKKNAYAKPVYVLTSPQTGSAAEAFAISTIAMKNIKRIGSETSGAMSTALEKKLPNGWIFAISNEVYMDNNSICYENKGVPVDYNLNYPKDRQTFFRSVVNDLETDKINILNAISFLEARNGSLISK